MLLQCIAIALFLTQYISISSVQQSYGWLCSYILLLSLNYFILHAILIYSNAISAVVFPDHDLIEEMKDQVLEHRNVRKELQKIVIKALEEMGVPYYNYRAFVRSKFTDAATKNEGGNLQLKDLKLFLQSLGVKYSPKKWVRLFSIIDYDRDKEISWVEISDLIFPTSASHTASMHKISSPEVRQEQSQIQDEISVRRSNSSSSNLLGLKRNDSSRNILTALREHHNDDSVEVRAKKALSSSNIGSKKLSEKDIEKGGSGGVPHSVSLTNDLSKLFDIRYSKARTSEEHTKSIIEDSEERHV